MVKMNLNSPITDEQWNIITDAELEHSDEVEFTTPSGKKVVYAKVRHGKWTRIGHIETWVVYKCSMCENQTIDNGNYCPNCGAKMDLDEVNDE